MPADPVGDLRTNENQLSVWEVAPDRSNLERVVRAIALSRNELAATGYVLFDSELLAPVDISLSVKQRGRTLDDGANDWHRDLVDLTGNKLVALARTILQHGESGTVLKKRLVELVEAGIRDKQLPEKCRKKLEGLAVDLDQH